MTTAPPMTTAVDLDATTTPAAFLPWALDLAIASALDVADVVQAADGRATVGDFLAELEAAVADASITSPPRMGTLTAHDPTVAAAVRVGPNVVLYVDGHPLAMLPTDTARAAALALLLA